MEAPRHAFVGLDLIDIASIAVTATTAVSVAANEKNAIRVVAAVLFTLFVPGRAIVSNWPSVGVRSPLAVSVLFSLSILTLAATVTLWSDYWRPIGLLEVECTISTVALLTAMLRRRSAARASDSAVPAMGQSQ